MEQVNKTEALLSVALFLMLMSSISKRKWNNNEFGRKISFKFTTGTCFYELNIVG